MSRAGSGLALGLGERKDTGLGLPRMGGLVGISVGPSRDLDLLSWPDTCPNLWSWIPGSPEVHTGSSLKACPSRSPPPPLTSEAGVGEVLEEWGKPSPKIPLPIIARCHQHAHPCPPPHTGLHCPMALWGFTRRRGSPNHGAHLVDLLIGSGLSLSILGGEILKLI